MSDFRQELYRRYVSVFTRHGSQVDAKVLANYWRWCERKLLPLLDGVDRRARILELGCGPGHLLEFLSRQGFVQAEGIDISDEQVSLATSRGLSARVADVFDALASCCASSQPSIAP